jgi:hypothetical protein
VKKEPEKERPGGPEPARAEPPPFDPDPRLITQLEGGRKADRRRRFKIAKDTAK